METERANQALTASEIFDLVREDLELVEKAIDAESVASVETVTTIGRYLITRYAGSPPVPARPAAQVRDLW